MAWKSKRGKFKMHNTLSVLRARLKDFTLSNAILFYSSVWAASEINGLTYLCKS